MNYPEARLHYLAVFTASCTWLLLGAGALVTGTGSGLAVPDWPLSFGTLFPQMEGGVFFEHGHRLVAGFVAILTLSQALVFSLFEKRPWVKRLSYLALVLVLSQALLGGLTVIFKLPPAVSLSHACLAQIFFCLTLVLALVTSPYWKKGPSLLPSDEGLLGVLVAFLSPLFFLQLLLGATMRHLGAGLAIPDFPLAFGSLIPEFASAEIAIHFAHRVGAVLVTVAVVCLSIVVLRKYQEHLDLTLLVGALLTIVVLQFVLGALTIWLMRPVWVTTLHLMIGALAFGLSVVITCLVMVKRPLRATRELSLEPV